MADRRLVESFRGVAEAIIPDPVLTTERATRSAINDDGTVRRDALSASLPWQRVDWDFATVTPGSGVGRRRVPQGCRIELLTIDAAVAPTTGSCSFRLNAGGETETIALPGGWTQNASANVNIVVDPGGTLTLDCLNDGGASGITITAFLSAYPGGS